MKGRLAVLTLMATFLFILGGVPQVIADSTQPKGPSDRIDAAHRVTLVLKEFRFEPSTLYLKAGEEFVLTIRNEGKIEHELMAGRDVVNTEQEKGYRTDLFTWLKPQQVIGTGYKLELLDEDREEHAEEENGITMISSEVELEPGGEVSFSFTVPVDAQGQWEFGCFLPGHYEAGMKGSLTILPASPSL